MTDAATALSSAQSSRGRILVAEDYEPNALFIMDVLELDGYEVDLAGNGCIAVEMAGMTAYDAIIMDIEMPQMDGVAATKAIRLQETAAGTQPVPILGISGHSLTSVRLLCLHAGMGDLITKPFLPATLEEKLRMMISSPSDAVK